MLKVEDKEQEKIDKFLKMINIDKNTIEFVSKNNILYTTKNNKAVVDLLNYILLVFPNASDIHLGKVKNDEFLILLKVGGSRISMPFKISKKDNYETASCKDNVFSMGLLKTLIEKMNNNTTIEDDIINNISVPLVGDFHLRTRIINKYIVIRLLPININKKPVLNFNTLYIKENPVYKVKTQIKDNDINLIDEYTLPTDLKNKVVNYNKVMTDMFLTIENKINMHIPKNCFVELEYGDDDLIELRVLENYQIPRIELDTIVFDYILINYKKFYNPVFNYFLESVINTQIEDNSYNTEEEFLNYLSVIKMTKI